MGYRSLLAKRMLFSRRGSLAGAILAVTVGILVIHVNFVIFQGLFDAIVRDISDYHNGDVLIYDGKGYIDRPDSSLVAWLERLPPVLAAAPRLSAQGVINTTVHGVLHEEPRVPVVGVDPLRDARASTVHETVARGQFVPTRNSAVLGASVAEALGGVGVGDGIDLTLTDRRGVDRERRLVVAGIAESPGGQGFDYSAVVHIETLRDMLGRGGETGSIMVRLHDRGDAGEVKRLFLAAYASDEYEAETIEESAEEQLAGFRSGIAMINMIGYFGMMSSAFAILTVQMMLVSGKTREIGIMRAIGARRRDVLAVFVIQGLLIGAVGASAGTAAGLGYTAYAKETRMTFAGSIPLEVSYDWAKVAQTALAAFALAVAASLYPAYRATKLAPVEAMRGA